jgi:hypothetical protein
MRTLAERVKSAAKGIPGLNECSFYIVAAEKKGFPALVEQSLAHVMQNMWLTAAAHGVGLQLLGLPAKEWALSGCLVGHPQTCSGGAGAAQRGRFHFLAAISRILKEIAMKQHIRTAPAGRHSVHLGQHGSRRRGAIDRAYCRIRPLA